MSLRKHARRARLACSLTGLLAAAGTAAASTFTVSPIRLELSAAHHTGVLTVHNDGDEPTLVQVRAVAWSQVNGEDQYTDTHEVLSTPPVFEIPAKGEQIVRVALLREPDPSRELEYRVFLEEVPHDPPPGVTGLSIALRLSLPVFILPAGSTRAQVLWHAQRLQDGSLEIDAANQGSAHLQISDFELRFAGQSTPVHVAQTRYALPNSEINWVVTPPPEAAQASSLQIHGFSDKGEFDAQADIAGP
jgi:fimbrial chaperone protein